MKHAMYCELGHWLAFVDPRTGLRAASASDFYEILRQEFDAENYPLPKFCPECGTKTTSTCPSCSSHIAYDDTKVKYRPNYCMVCGEGFPWTTTALATASEFTDELDELSEEDKQTLKGTFVELTRDTPRTEVAMRRFNAAMSKMGKPAAAAIWRIVESVATDWVKRKMDGM